MLWHRIADDLLLASRTLAHQSVWLDETTRGQWRTMLIFFLQKTWSLEESKGSRRWYWITRRCWWGPWPAQLDQMLSCFTSEEIFFFLWWHNFWSSAELRWVLYFGKRINTEFFFYLFFHVEDSSQVRFHVGDAGWLLLRDGGGGCFGLVAEVLFLVLDFFGAALLKLWL